MRAPRTAAVGLMAGALALTLVAAETSPTTTGAGTASTQLLGAVARVTGPVSTPTLNLLDVESFATTTGTPSALTEIVPISVGDEAVGRSGASSSADGSASTERASYGEVAGPLALTVEPIQTTASATADRALATVETATADLSALFGALGLDLTSSGISSLATRDAAAATQGLQVSGLDLDLADLGLDADLLGQLGLGNILDLLGSLPGLLPSDLADVAEIQGLLDDLDASLATLSIDGAAAQEFLAELTSVAQELAALEALQATLQALTSLNVTELLSALTDADLLADLEAVDCALGTVNPLDPLAAVQDALDCVTAQVTSLSATVDSLTGLLPDELDPVLVQLGVVTDLVDQILAGVGDLDDLLALLPDLLGDAAGFELLSVGAFDVGTRAVAGRTVEDSSATLLCDAVDVRVLGNALPTPDCSGALSQLTDASAVINGAVGQVTDVLNALPLGDLVEVGDLRAEVFTDLVEQVTEADGVVTATAGFTLLDLEVPSVTIDPSQVTDGLAGLGLPNVLGPVESVLSELQSGLSALDGLGIGGAGDLLTTVNGTLSDVGAPDGLTGTVDQVAGLLDGLELGELGTLTESISTPGLELLIDPVSTASFSATAAPAPAPTAPAPAPAPDAAPTPSLPTTGGGFALLGVLAMAGAAGLRRRP